MCQINNVFEDPSFFFVSFVTKLQDNIISLYLKIRNSLNIKPKIVNFERQ